MDHDVKQGDVLTFENKMVGTVTAGFKLALMDRRGNVTKKDHMPLLSDYNDRYRVVRIDTRDSDKDDYRLVWKNEDFDFKRWCYKHGNKPAQALAA